MEMTLIFHIRLEKFWRSGVVPHSQYPSLRLIQTNPSSSLFSHQIDPPAPLHSHKNNPCQPTTESNTAHILCEIDYSHAPPSQTSHPSDPQPPLHPVSTQALRRHHHPTTQTRRRHLCRLRLPLRQRRPTAAPALRRSQGQPHPRP